MPQQRVVPMLSYEDVGAAADWLVAAFGFEEVERYDWEGRVAHVTLELGEGVVYLGSPSADYKSPNTLAAECDGARRNLETPYVVDGVMVYVDDVESHFDRARSAGATLLGDLEENAELGERRYRVADIEGHRWMFVQGV